MHGDNQPDPAGTCRRRVSWRGDERLTGWANAHPMLDEKSMDHDREPVVKRKYGLPKVRLWLIDNGVGSVFRASAQRSTVTLSEMALVV